MHLPKIEFLWDEEKSNKFLRSFSLLVIAGAFIGIGHALILPAGTPLYFKITLLVNDVVVGLFCLTNIIFQRKQGSAHRLLVTFLALQFSSALTMTFTGGFRSPVQFGPYGLMLMTAFQLGNQSVYILSVFSLVTFVGMYIWQLLIFHDPNVFQDFFFYVGIYAVLMFLFRNLGKQLSLQIEARKKIEQVDDMKNQFITLSSHYLRTPLAVIKGNVGQIQKFIFSLPNSKSQQDQRINLENINLKIRELESLIDKFLLIASIERGQTQILFIPSDINLAIKEAVENYQPMARDDRVRLYLDPQPVKIPDFPFDVNKIKDVVSSIIENAILHNKIGGSVNVGLIQQGNWVGVRVADSGVGMNKNQIDNIFTAFNKGGMEKVLTFDKPGIGLSLYLAKLIVEAHRGRIDIQSEEGRGSVFTVWLPMK